MAPLARLLLGRLKAFVNQKGNFKQPQNTLCVAARTDKGKDASANRGTNRYSASSPRAGDEGQESNMDTYDHHDNTDGEEAKDSNSFPASKLSLTGNTEIIIYPSYARRHMGNAENPANPGVADFHRDSDDIDYWQNEWEIHEDFNAVVDVDVRGWIYTPAIGAMTRKNRLFMSVARKISGVPAPVGSLPTSASNSRASSLFRGQPRNWEEEIPNRQALDNTANGDQKPAIADRGMHATMDNHSQPAEPSHGEAVQAWAETPPSDLELVGLHRHLSRTKNTDPSREELAIANRHLVNRLKPFMASPVAGLAFTIRFYNDTTSQPLSALTDQFGHFNFRASLNFVPTSVQVIVSETLSISQEVIITEPQGVSIISDIDDTIKHSAIGAGAREIFRNAFIRNFSDLTITGVKEWYWRMANLGAKIHYVSNSPWQMYPVLHSYFQEADLPPGSYHLKQYNGMLQGVFEPVAERKRRTIDRLFSDFPGRKFILIGDSGEADLEAYTETALMLPGRVLGIFIRDVTTDPKKPFLSSSMSWNIEQANTWPPSPASPSSPTLSPLSGKFKQAAEIELPGQGETIDLSENLGPGAPRPRLPGSPIEEARENSLAPLKPVLPSKLPGLCSKLNDDAAPDAPMINAAATVESFILGAAVRFGNLASMLRQKQQQLAVNQPEACSEIPESSTPSSAKKAEFPAQPRRGVNDSPAPESTIMKPLPASSRARSFSESSICTSMTEELPPLYPWRSHSPYTIASIQHAIHKGHAMQTESSSEISHDRRIELWRRRWERSEKVLKPKGVVLRSWKVGGDIETIALDLIQTAQMEWHQEKEHEIDHS